MVFIQMWFYTVMILTRAILNHDIKPRYVTAYNFNSDILHSFDQQLELLMTRSLGTTVQTNIHVSP